MREVLFFLNEGMDAGGELVKTVRFVDDKTFVCYSEEGLQRMVDILVRMVSVFRKKVNLPKTIVMKIARKEQGAVSIRIENQTLEKVKHLK